MVSYATRLSEALNVVGLMNIQFVIEDDQAYVIEVNPRASRTVPYLSKITGIPMVKAATWACLGRTLAEQGYRQRPASEPAQHRRQSAGVFVRQTDRCGHQS